MVLLVISTKIGFFTACLIVDGKTVSGRINSKTASVLSKEILGDLLLEAGINVGNIDYIVFLGKPLAYFERLVNLHIFFYPFYFLSFVSDFKDFFMEKIRIKALAQERLGYFKDICFLEPVEAIAHEIGIAFLPKDGIVIVSFSGSINLRTFGCYRKEGRRMFLLRELAYPSCISMFYHLRTQGHSAAPVKMKDLLKFSKDLSFILKRKFFQYQGGMVALKEGYRVEKKECTFYFEEVFSGIINSAGRGLDEKAIFVSDYPIDLETSERLSSKFKNLQFISLNKIEIMEYAAKYTVRRVKL